MPWSPELFSAPAVERIAETTGQDATTIPFFAGLLTGELDALIGSFAGVPEVHVPQRGRVRGERAFSAFVSEMTDSFARRNASIEPVALTVTERHGCEETVLHLDGGNGRVALPVAVLADHRDGSRLEELRVYFSNWPLEGRHLGREPLLQPVPGLQEHDAVGSYQRALAEGELDAIVDLFEEDGYAREPAGGEFVHRGPEALRSFYELLFSGGGGIPLQHCAVIDDAGVCAVEYNVVRWGRTELPPQAGVAVYERGAHGGLAAARIYDDVDPPVAGRAVRRASGLPI